MPKGLENEKQDDPDQVSIALYLFFETKDSLSQKHVLVPVRSVIRHEAVANGSSRQSNLFRVAPSPATLPPSQPPNSLLPCTESILG